ncbi:hypothetical protein EBB54_03290 [Schaedlerella arabinosiphila]|jgi:hypothetical protein|uniref:Uncharacterized protein n=1 Tax=Schaedlerella arabinosiphila TaxID=2044587 RepID=A0A426DCP3_9FIRM|nr:hypothetical protein [Schaedlerella arabinosiphila]RRK30511.1 hypothetical protein EBB54_03290 [Schaedlerella arabinosiphila]
MDLTKESQQRTEFCDILFELAKSQELLQDAYYRSSMYRRLESLYDAESQDKRFRHFYTDIFSVLTQIQQNPKLGDINILGQNLAMIRSGYKPQNKAADEKRIIDVSDAIKKLYDHVNLDIARITYSDGANRKISGESSLEILQSQINALQQKAQEIKKDYGDTEKKIIEVENKLDNSQKEYITILGIFAAVVLAFTGGIAFSTSVLNNIAQSSVYRTISVALIIGLVLINVLFGLFYYINSLVNKEKKIFPLLISNIVIIILLKLRTLISAYAS